jgi:hypothetical protein
MKIILKIKYVHPKILWINLKNEEITLNTTFQSITLFILPSPCLRWMTGCSNEERNSQIINNACIRIIEQP